MDWTTELWKWQHTVLPPRTASEKVAWHASHSASEKWFLEQIRAQDRVWRKTTSASGRVSNSQATLSKVQRLVVVVAEHLQKKKLFVKNFAR